MTLDDLAVACGADKHQHGYCRLYDKIFLPFRYKNIAILEMGIGCGGSLGMWTKYFTNARAVVGLDINPWCLEGCAYSGAEIVIGDQRDDILLSELSAKAGGFDIIIDDASHRGGYSIKSFETLFPMLLPGGIYVIEDLHTGYLADCTFGPTSITDYLKHLIDVIQLWGKSGYGDIAHDPKRGELLLTPMEEQIESMSIWKSIAFIHKRPA